MRGLRGTRLRELLQPFGQGGEEKQFAGLTALAADVLEDAGLSPTRDRAAAARALSNYFHRSGEFFYTLEPQIRDPQLDPLEDFVTRHQFGHCEYFSGRWC